MPFVCAECNELGARLIFGLEDTRLCKNCKILFKYRMISKTHALKNYALNKNDLTGLEYIEVGNPLYRGAQNMILYKEKQILDLFINKYFNKIEINDRNYLSNVSNSLEHDMNEYKNIINKIIELIVLEKNEKKTKK